MSNDLVTFGEAMIRLSPPSHGRIEDATGFDIRVGGAELNVAVGARRLGLSSAWVSRLPENPLGRRISRDAAKEGVDVSDVAFASDGRAGIYFVEFGAAPRPNRVVYDRAHSSFAGIKSGDVDWKAVFKGAQAFHTSGITPAVSPSSRQATLDAIKAAKKAGCLVSYDLNYRAKLWSEAEARKIQEPMMKYVDILITTEEDAGRVFGIKGSDYRDVAYALGKKYKFKIVAITIREDVSVLRNRWSAILCVGGRMLESQKYDVEIVDRVGAGDSFTAGFLYGYLTGGAEKGLRYGVAFSAIKHSIPGDFCLSSREEVEHLLQGKGLRIVR